MDVPTRLETNAILDRLIADGKTFSRDDARRLIDLVPITRSHRLSFKGSFTSRGSSLRGHAAGIGDVDLKAWEREKQIALNVPVSHKIGGYVVTHTPGHIAIELMWNETHVDQTGRSCSLTYDRVTKEPELMSIAVQKTLTVLFLSLAYVSFVPWKTPISTKV